MKENEIYFPNNEISFSPPEPSQCLWELPSDSSNDLSLRKMAGAR